MTIEIEHTTIAAIFWFSSFGIFHSVGAQDGFKERLTKLFGNTFTEYYWRLVYCTISYLLFCKAVDKIFTIPGWHDAVIFESSAGFNLFRASCELFGIILLYWAFLQVDYLEFWGFKHFITGIGKCFQCNFDIRPKRNFGTERLEASGIYKVIRNPMYVGAILYAISDLPTYSGAMFTILIVVYVIVGNHFEQKRLERNLGQAFLKYRNEVGAYFPWQLIWKKRV